MFIFTHVFLIAVHFTDCLKDLLNIIKLKGIDVLGDVFTQNLTFEVIFNLFLMGL